MSPPSSYERRWLILALIALAQLMVVLDATIVNIALPSAQQDLGFGTTSASGLSPPTRWRSAPCCCSAADSATSSGASGPSLSGCSGSPSPPRWAAPRRSFGVLVAARARQGAFGALLAPSALVAADDDVRRPESAARRSASSARSPAAARRSACSSAAS